MEISTISDMLTKSGNFTTRFFLWVGILDFLPGEWRTLIKCNVSSFCQSKSVSNLDVDQDRSTRQAG